MKLRAERVPDPPRSGFVHVRIVYLEPDLPTSSVWIPETMSPELLEDIFRDAYCERMMRKGAPAQ